MARIRLFVALELPEHVKGELARAIGVLQPSLPNAKWVPAENLHLTLSFLGWAEAEQIHAVSSAIASVVASQVDFAARLGEMGTFPTPRRARIVWAGLDDPTAGLIGLAAAVADGMASVGFPQDERPFRAHLTIARLRVPGTVDLTGVELQPLPVPVERVTLFQSHLGKPAPRYEALATFPFRRV